MRPIQCIRDLDPILQHLLRRQRAFKQTALQRVPFQKLQHQEASAILMPDIVERADVRVIQ